MWGMPFPRALQGERVRSPIEKAMVIAVTRFLLEKESIIRPMWGHEYGKADEDP